MIGNINMTEDISDLYLKQPPSIFKQLRSFSYKNLLEFVRTLTSIIILTLFLLSGYSTLKGIYAIDRVEFYNILLLFASTALVVSVKFLTRKKTPANGRFCEKMFLPIMLSLLIISAGISIGLPWIFFLLTNTIVQDSDYPLILLGHLIMFSLPSFQCFAKHANFIRLFPGILSFISIAENRIGKYRKENVFIFNQSLSITGATTCLLVILTVLCPLVRSYLEEFRQYNYI
ncbi:hypothetical protein NEAUS03_1532 [Nematocida ausubeli]|nr:hypothetical protein NEAUS03_1532 [Nematocida ausubeli]